jgi:hypothetical protein
MDVANEELLDKAAAALNQREADFDRAWSRVELNAELAEKLAPFEKGGMWEYAPPEARKQAEADIRAKHATRLGEALFTAEHTARAIEVNLAPYVERAQLPPDPQAAHERRAGRVGLSFSDRCALDLLDEHRQARFDREYASMMPSRVDAEYVQALLDPTDQVNASYIRWVETKHRGSWRGADVAGDADEALHAHKLKNRIEETRKARIPDHIKAMSDAIARVYGKADAARKRGARSLRPAGWRV